MKIFTKKLNYFNVFLIIEILQNSIKLKNDEIIPYIGEMCELVFLRVVNVQKGDN